MIENEIEENDFLLANRPKNKSLDKFKNIKSFMQYIGFAGEHAVLSKLMFQGINVMKSFIDEGFDLVATNEGKLFFIQVKTTFLSTKNEYLFNIDIKKEAVNFKGEFQPVYVFVLTEDGNETNFVVLTREDIERQIDLGKIWYMKSNDTHRVKFYFREGKLSIGNLDNEAMEFLNNWKVFGNSKNSLDNKRVVA